MNIGDKVRLLRAKEQGVVSRFLPGGLIEIEIEDGFRIPVMRSELVMVSPLEAERLLRNTTYTEQKTIAPAATAILANQGIYLAFVPINDREYTLHLINNTDWEFPYVLGEESTVAGASVQFRGVHTGVLKAKSQQKMNDHYVHAKFDEWPTFLVQGLWFRAGKTVLRMPLIKRFKARAATLFKQKTTIPVLNQPGFLVQLDTENQEPPTTQAKLVPLRSDDLKASMFEPKSDGNLVAIEPPSSVVDLHIEALLPNGKGNRTPADLLKLQLNTFEKALENAIAAGMHEITFIHGVGSGALRTELHKRLGKHPNVRFFEDAQKQKFGYGASRLQSSKFGKRIDKKSTGFTTFVIAIYVALSLVSCQPTTRLNPKAPKEAYNTTEMEVRNERFLSTVHIPVSVAMTDVERQINSQVKGLIYEDNSLDDNNRDQFMVKVWKRGTILVTAKDSMFYFTVPLRIWAKAGMSVLGFTQYKETDFEIDLRFKTLFDLDPDWSVHTQTQADGYGWVRRPTVNMIGLNIPVTNLVGRLIDKNLGEITKALDQQIRRNIDLRTPVLKVWNTLREPYLLSEKYRTYLQIVPKLVLITPLRFEGSYIRSTIGIEGHTLTTTGSKPTVRSAVSLPDLVVVPKIKDDFQIGLLSEISYSEAAQLAAAEFVGKIFSFNNNRQSITITSMDMFGQNESLIIKVGIKGSIAGDIYLKGRPFYDAHDQTITLKDLQYDLDTRSVLARSASWLLKGTFARMLEKQLTIPVGSQIADMQKLLQDQLKNNQLAKGVVLNGRIDEIKPDRVFLTPEMMLALVNARGQVDVKIEGL